MSCQVYKYDQRKIEAAKKLYDESDGERYDEANELEEVASSHNGLLYGLSALTSHAGKAIWNNDIDICHADILQGIKNYEDRENAPQANREQMERLQATRPDHLDDAVKVLREAKAGGYQLVLG